MPWCEDCSKFWNPNSLPPDGTCPTCGRIIGEVPDTKVPWHFYLLLAALVVYLGWRAVQGFEWLLTNDHNGWAIVAGLLIVVLVAGGAAWNWWPEDKDADADGSGHVPT